MSARVLIAGSGVAGLEALLALHALAGSRVTTTVLSPVPRFALRAATVGMPFGRPQPTAHDVETVVADHAGRLHPGVLRAVRREERCAVTHDGDELFYDHLIVAVGARAVPAYDLGLVFRGAEDAGAVSDVLAGVDAGRIASIAFVVPPGVTWSLPIYELALMTAAHAELRGLDVELTVVTAEPEPLTAFGRKSTEHVVEALAAAGVHLQTGTDVAAVGPGGALVGRDGYSLARAESVIAVPRLEGPDIGGLPHDDQGFVTVDAGGAVPRVPGVYAVGDAAAGPIKHGGLAAQQAEHVAHVIAQLAGAPVSVPEPRPMMRAHLLEGASSSYLRAPLDGEGRGGVVSAEPLWWPPLKVAAPRLAGLLAERGS